MQNKVSIWFGEKNGKGGYQANADMQTVLSNAASAKALRNAIFKVVSDFKKGSFKGGTTINYGIKDGAVDIAPSTSKMIPAELMKEVESLRQKIITSKINIPKDQKSFDNFLKTIK
jgi:basic membrane protein A